MRKLLSILVLFISINSVFAQSTNDTNKANNIQQSRVLSFLSKIKLSGYIQTQFQMTDSAGAPAYFAGGDFGMYSNKRFTVRRGRIGIAYEASLTKVSFQIDITERGIGVKDAYLQVTEPWLKAFSLTSGIFYRPFGFELNYSSSLRESPERSRVIQTLFPMERDLGAMLTFQMPETSKLSFLKIQIGAFGGNAVNTETNSFFDYIGRIRISNPIKSSFIDYALGFSYYNGKYAHINDFDGNIQDKKFIFIVKTDSIGNKSFEKDSSYMKTGRREVTPIKREYLGFDAEISFNFPFGKTTLRGEYIFGTQPSPIGELTGPNYLYNSSSISPTGMYLGIYWNQYSNPLSIRPGAVQAALRYENTFIRKFNGACFYFIQNIWKTRHQLIFKYDWYDPNTDLSGKDIIGTNITTSADIKYTTMGFGANLFYKNINLLIFYELVKNEVTSIGPLDDQNIAKGIFPSSGFTKNVKDNIFTLRLQYKF